MFDWVIGFVEQSGYVGIALLMLLENVFPPIPSELIMPLAGIADMKLAKFLVYTTAGTMLWTGLLAGTGYLWC